MKILIDIGHPAHVHFFKNLIWNLEKKNHQVLVTVIDKEVAVELLLAYNIKHIVVGKMRSKRHKLVLEWLKRDYEIVKIAKKFNPDILMGIANPCISHSAKILKKRAIIFDDTDHASFSHRITYPFADIIITPSSFKKYIGRRQITYSGYHELAYLHPKYFTPDPSVLDEIGVSQDDNIFLIRFAAFNASHDKKSGYFKKEYLLPLIQKLEKKGKVIITSERKLDGWLQKYQCKLPPDKYHDLLYFSKMYIGEGSTSAEEAAILGVPSIHFERLVINGEVTGISQFIGVIDELQNKYGLLYSFYNEESLLKKVDEILLDPIESKKNWMLNRNKMLRDSVDLTEFMLWIIENYPSSYEKLRREHSNIYYIDSLFKSPL